MHIIILALLTQVPSFAGQPTARVAGGSSGISYWYDGGSAGPTVTSGSIFAKEFITNPDAGASLTLRGGGVWFWDSSGTPNANAIQPQRATSGVGTLGTLDILGPARVITNISNGINGASALTAVQNGSNSAPTLTLDNIPAGSNTYTELLLKYSSASRISLSSDSSSNVNLCTFSGVPFNFRIADATCSTIDLAITTGGVLQSNQTSGNNAVAFATAGARLDLGTGATDYLFSDGTNTVVAGGVKLGGSTASTITSSFECNWATDGGNGINAGTQREYTIGCTGANQNAECILSVPSGGAFQTQGVSIDCFVPASNQVGIRTYNWTSGTDGLSPKQGTYKVRVFNNQ